MHYIQPFLLALAVSYSLTPVVRRLAIRLGALDQPVSRSTHTEPKPFLGGLAIYVSFFAAVAYAVLGSGQFTGGTRGDLWGVFLGGTLILLLGVVDDLIALHAGVKLAGQVVAAVVLVFFGLRIDWLTNPFGQLFLLPGWVGSALTVVWVVAVTNVVNLADGLDGLAAGISTIASVTLLMVAMQQHQAGTVLLTASLAGATLGFLPYNFNPAKIFMGDAGAMFLGFTLAAISVQGTLKSAATVALVVPILALGLPIADTFFAIVRRTANGRPIHEADRGHLHHRLMQLGLSHRDTVVVMWVISGWLGISAIALTQLGWASAAVVVIFVVASLFYGARKVGILRLHEPKKQR